MDTLPLEDSVIIDNIPHRKWKCGICETHYYVNQETFNILEKIGSCAECQKEMTYEQAMGEDL